jgi:prevent-host-death family protein
MAKAKTANASRISRIIPALTARTQFGQILDRVKKDNEKFVIEKRGEGQAVIISLDEYVRLFARPTPSVEAIRRDAEAKLARRELAKKKNG